MNTQTQGMDELKRWYREGLAARINALETAGEELRSNSSEAAESIRRIAHSLRGSGGTYGFPEITAAAAAIEDAEEEDLEDRLGTLLKSLYEVRASNDTQKHGVLIIDDDADILEVLGAKLTTPNRVVYTARNSAEAEELLATREISLIFLDLVLPDMDGRNLLVRLRKNFRTAGLPIFVLSALSGLKPKTECFALGADEYFEKPFDATLLAAAVSSKLDRCDQITRELRQDSLTGMPNRAAFHEAFERAGALASRTKQPLSVGILDLDHFKEINDKHGHVTGDIVLRDAAAVVARSLRLSDYLARWGGEEFVVLFPNTDAEGARHALEKALETLREARFQGADGQTLSITFSAGIAQWTEAASVEEAISDADRFLYIAKAEGRNRIVISEDTIPARRRKVIIGDDDELIVAVIKHRLERDGFDVVQAGNGGEVLNLALESDVSLVLLDVRMPGMDGFELLGRLRALPSFGHIPIVMLTSMGSEKDIVRGIELGANDYIVKPFSLLELLARIHRLLK